MNRTIMMTLVALALGLSACGDDGGTPTTDSGMDATRGDAGGDGGGDAEVVDCMGMPDGTICTEGFICLREACAPSECGDGFIDGNEPTPEDCDDGNEVPGDGCEPSVCVFTCADDTQCDNGNNCDGAETCNTSLHRCQAGVPANGAVCTIDGAADGVCREGLCADANCGDGVVNGDSEVCDDGNDVNEDGCRVDCQYSCVEDLDCTDADECTGVETCDTGTHICNNPADLDCDDSEVCTADSCDAMTGCVNELIDVDGDGYAVATCTGSGFMGGDCDDMNNTAYPGAPELCDMIDNDCDSAVDNDTTIVTCMRDQDGDEYGDPTVTMESCSCPAGYIPPRADGKTDCRDNIASFHPDQYSYFTTGYCGGSFCLPWVGDFDYNCDGTETQRYTQTNRDSCYVLAGTRCLGSGWTGGTVPACGRDGEFYSCVNRLVGFPRTYACTGRIVSAQTQGCR